MLPTQMTETSKNNNRISRFFKKSISQMRAQDAEALHYPRIQAFWRTQQNGRDAVEALHYPRIQAREAGFAAGCGGRYQLLARNY